MTEYDILNDFYLAYWEWLEIDAPEENKQDFHRGIGLCGNLNYFCNNHAAAEVAGKEMRCQFRNDGLNTDYPFGGFHIYFGESDRDTCYLNQARRDWVQEKVERFR